MSAPRMRSDLDDARRRTRWTMSTSAVVHALLLLLFTVAAKPGAGQGPELTEITLLEPGDAAPAAAAPNAGQTQKAPVVPASAAPSDAHFTRALNRASLSPTPQTSALEDQMDARLAALQHAAPAAPIADAPLKTAGVAWGTPAGIGATPVGGTGTALTLHRSGGEGANPLALTRGGGGGNALAPAVAATGIPADKQAGAPAREGEAAVRRSLAGASLAGPIADRAILHFVPPVYPEWAKRDAVEGSVTLYFTVRPDGSVSDNVLVQKTAGFEDFDESARTALKAWRFEPLRDGRTGDQWGTITFHFRLRDN